jgi:hypothetical protein
LGLSVVALLLGVIGHMEPGTSYLYLGAVLFLTGFGVGTAFVPATDTVMGAVPQANAGLASAINDAGRQVGAALGIAVLGALTNAAYTAGIAGPASRLSTDLGTLVRASAGAALQLADQIGGPGGDAMREAVTAAFTDGFRLAMLAGAGMMAAGAILILRHLPSRDVAFYDAASTQAGAAVTLKDDDGLAQ